MGPVYIQDGSSRRDTGFTPAFSITILLVLLAILGSPASYSGAQGDDQIPPKEFTLGESASAPTTEEAETLGSETSPEPELSSKQADITPAIEVLGSTESEIGNGRETTDKNQTEQVTQVVILVQGNKGNLKPIRGAEVFISIKDHADMQTSTNAKGLANISIPSGRVKIQVTAKDWKTFGEFYDLNDESEEIKIILESRNPGSP